MTLVEMDSGACGFSITVQAEKTDRRQADVRIESKCERVAELARLITELNFKDIFVPLDKNPVFIAAGQSKLHATCPAACGILKAVEAELGLAVKKDVTISFCNEK